MIQFKNNFLINFFYILNQVRKKKHKYIMSNTKNCYKIENSSYNLLLIKI